GGAGRGGRAGPGRAEGAGLDPPRRRRAAGEAGAEPLPHGVRDGRPDAFEPLLVAPARARGHELPVPLEALALALDHEDMARWDLANAAQGRLVARDVLQREVGVDRVEIDVARQSRQAQQRLQLRRERERPVLETRVQERLLAEAIACEHEPLT